MGPADTSTEEHVLSSPRAELPERVRLLCMAGQLAIFKMSKVTLNRLEGRAGEHPVKKSRFPTQGLSLRGACKGHVHTSLYL